MTREVKPTAPKLVAFSPLGSEAFAVIRELSAGEFEEAQRDMTRGLAVDVLTPSLAESRAIEKRAEMYRRFEDLRREHGLPSRAPRTRKRYRYATPKKGKP